MSYFNIWSRIQGLPNRKARKMSINPISSDKKSGRNSAKKIFANQSFILSKLQLDFGGCFQ